MTKTTNVKPLTTNQIILKTAGKTSAVLLVLLVLISSLFVLLAPIRASDFFYKFGMRGISAKIAYSGARTSNTFDDWWVSLVRCVGTKNNKKAYESADRLENLDNYASMISKKEITVPISAGQNIVYDAKHYVAYYKVKCSLLADSSSKDAMWRYTKDWVLAHGWGSYVSIGATYSLNPCKGYLASLTENIKIPLGDILTKMDNLYNMKGEFADLKNELTYAAKEDLQNCVLKLLNARSGEVSEDVVNYWKNIKK